MSGHLRPSLLMTYVMILISPCGSPHRADICEHKPSVTSSHSYVLKLPSSLFIYLFSFNVTFAVAPTADKERYPVYCFRTLMKLVYLSTWQNPKSLEIIACLLLHTWVNSLLYWYPGLLFSPWNQTYVSTTDICVMKKEALQSCWGKISRFETLAIRRWLIK